jgi:hypothetical protein
MKHRIGTLLQSFGHIVNFLTLLAAFVYVVSAIAWIHAPVLSALKMTATMALLPLGMAWLCRGIGRHLQQKQTERTWSLSQRRLLFGIGIIIALASATIVHRLHGIYTCSVDRSRNAAFYEGETRRNGFERVCEGDLARFDISLKSIKKATRDLAFTPVDLTHTPFAQFESVGGLAEYMGDVPAILYRGFRLPDGHTLILYEHDMSADGVTTWRNPKDEPERINGMAARLVVKEDPLGSAVSHLSWVEGRRDYQLWIDANLVRKPLREQLFALAASLPHSVPACPNEPPPKQWKFDKNGRRIEEPPPAVLTEEQFDAMADKRKRPCK